MFSSPVLAAAEAYSLVSWWKPLLLLLPFVPWAVIVSKVLDKHAARFILPRQEWGAAHLIAGTLAVLIAISLPMREEFTFWIGWGVMILILVGDIVAFALITNKDDRVPETFRLKLDMSSWTKAREEKAKQKLQGKVELVVRGPDKSTFAPPNAGTPEFDVRVAAENVVLRAFAARASQVEFAPAGKDNLYSVAFMVDGMRQPAVLNEPVQTKDGPPPPPPGILPGAEAIKIMDLWKTGAKLDVNERRKKQTADISVERGTQKTKIRLTSIGAQAGMRLTMLFDPEKQVQRAAKNLGLLEPQMEAVKALVEDSTGVVIVASPLDGGRTTTFYTVLKMHDAYTRNVQTIEVDQQDSLEGVKQTPFDPQAEGAEFSTLVRSQLRRDPDVLGVAELPDAATAKEIAKVDAERTRVYVSFRADSAMQALQAYVKAVGDPGVAANTIRGVICQRLFRKLCTNCRVAYQPTPDMLKKLNLPGDQIKQLFKKGGQVLVKNKPETCPACSGAGFVGLDAAFEIYPLGEAERALVKSQDWNAIKMELRKKKVLSIQQAALRKALDGVTSVEEVLRATAEAEPAPKPATPQPAAAAAPKA